MWDKFNFKVSYLCLNDYQLEFQCQVWIVVGGDVKFGQCDVYVLEINVYIVLILYIVLELLVQYIFNLDNYYNFGVCELSGDGFVVGL